MTQLESPKSSPRVLIAIMSWVIACRNGVNQVQRDTFLRDVAKYPNLDYKIFLGDGTPTGEDEYDNNKSIEGATDYVRENNALNKPVPFDYVPKEDEVVLHVPDDFIHASYKAKAMWQWALDRDYDYVFQCMSDTYVDIEQLMNCGFEEHDFIGRTYDTNRCPLGGSGYWLSKKCLQIMTAAHVDFWADDGWAGWTLQKSGIHLHQDLRYNTELPLDWFLIGTAYPQSGYISLHMGPSYEKMREIYKGVE